MTPRPPNTPPIITNSKQLQFAPAKQARHFRIAWWLALATIGYNLLEGAFCTIFGYQDDSITLFGFGLDSFIGAVFIV